MGCLPARSDLQRSEGAYSLKNAFFSFFLSRSLGGVDPSGDTWPQSSQARLEGCGHSQQVASDEMSTLRTKRDLLPWCACTPDL